MSDKALLSKGAGWFNFEDVAVGNRGWLRVFYYVPEWINPSSRPLIALHGLDRAASEFRDVFISSSEMIGKIVVVPEFDVDAFPGIYAYNYGNVVSPPLTLNIIVENYGTLAL
jgi:hypothetical protein